MKQAQSMVEHAPLVVATAVALGLASFLLSGWAVMLGIGLSPTGSGGVAWKLILMSLPLAPVAAPLFGWIMLWDNRRKSAVMAALVGLVVSMVLFGYRLYFQFR